MESETAAGRFNAEARDTLKHAYEHARIRGHTQVSTAHLLLGLLDDPQCVAARALWAMSLDQVTLSYLPLPTTSQMPSVGEEVGLTPGAQRAIERAVSEANKTGQRDIGSEHLLLGLFTGQGEAAESALTHLGASLDEARRQVLGVLERSQFPSIEASRPTAKPVKAHWLKQQGILLLIIFVPLVLFFELALLLQIVQPASWLLWLALAQILYSLAVMRLRTQLMISPLYTITPLPQSELAQRWMALAKHVCTPIRGIFVMNRQEKPLRANAFCVGWGRASHILLTDTLVERFPPDEIEVILAHELGHLAYRDHWKQFFTRVLSLLSLFAVLQYVLPPLHVGLLNGALAGFVAIICFIISNTIGNTLFQIGSRSREYQADEYALHVTGKIRAFQNAMARLVYTNGTQSRGRRPVSFSWSYPTLAERLRHADEFAARQRTAVGTGDN
ncbi:MAG TPA: M48 family metalloprotease [Ktedonobacteraceae bacterium]|nr:M48 family metalloprotease [Ktedonobacteraceae bacterium]